MTIQDDFTAQTRKTAKQAQDIATGVFNAVAERVTPLLPKFDSLDLPKLLANARAAVDKATKSPFKGAEAVTPAVKKPSAKKTGASATAE